MDFVLQVAVATKAGKKLSSLWMATKEKCNANWKIN